MDKFHKSARTNNALLASDCVSRFHQAVFGAESESWPVDKKITAYIMGALAAKSGSILAANGYSSDKVELAKVFFSRPDSFGTAEDFSKLAQFIRLTALRAPASSTDIAAYVDTKAINLINTVMSSTLHIPAPSNAVTALVRYYAVIHPETLKVLPMVIGDNPQSAHFINIEAVTGMKSMLQSKQPIIDHNSIHMIKCMFAHNQ